MNTQNEETCSKCYWFDPEEEINGEKGCCMRFLIHVEETTVREGIDCFRKGTNDNE